MFVKIEGHDGSATHECDSMSKKNLPDGLEVELGRTGKVLRLPEDGQVIYVMNDWGKTLEVIRWPHT